MDSSYRARSRGYYGEAELFEQLMQLPGNKNIYSNCYIPTGPDTFSEVDSIMIHETGIYVFECKNYSGWIYGSENQQYWTQVLPSYQGDSTKRRFYNPILQNLTHIKWLRAFLNCYPKMPYYSYVIFGNDCEFKNLYVNSFQNAVIKMFGVYPAVSHRISTSSYSMHLDTVRRLSALICPLTSADPEIRWKHIQNIQNSRI